jgi:hypothetical protein
MKSLKKADWPDAREIHEIVEDMKVIDFANL